MSTENTLDAICSPYVLNAGSVSCAAFRSLDTSAIKVLVRTKSSARVSKLRTCKKAIDTNRLFGVLAINQIRPNSRGKKSTWQNAESLQPSSLRLSSTMVLVLVLSQELRCASSFSKRSIFASVLWNNVVLDILCVGVLEGPGPARPEDSQCGIGYLQLAYAQ